MPTQIRIAGVTPGSGSIAEVSLHRLGLRQRTRFERAIREGRAFSWATLTYDPDAHDTIIGLQNNHPDRLLRLERLIFFSDTASQIQIFTGTGVTMAGTAVPGVNLKREASGLVAKATGICDETGNGAQAAGYSSAAYSFLFRDVVALNTKKRIDLHGLAIPYGTMIGVDLTTAATAANAVLLGWFD